MSRSNTPRKPPGAGWRGGVTKKKPGTDRRKRRLWLAVLPVLIVAASFGIWQIWRAIKPHANAVFVAAVVRNYKDAQLPADPTAAADFAALRDVATSSAKGWTDIDGLDPTALAASLRDLGPKQPVVVILSALATTTTTDTGGEPGVALLPADVRADRVSGVPLRAFLEAVRDCPSREKLVVLDLMRPWADPRLGHPIDTASKAVAADLAAVPDPNRLVLTASGPGQTAIASEAAARSIFRASLARGLQGAARPEGRTASAVNVRALMGFVASDVASWSRSASGKTQTPVSIGPTDLDFPLTLPTARPADALAAQARTQVAAKKDDAATKKDDPATKKADTAKTETAETAKANAPSNDPDARAYPEFLAKGWARYSSWQAGERPLATLAPRAHQRYGMALVRAEHAWRYGADVAEIIEELDRLTASASVAKEEDWRAVSDPAPPSLRSLALARSFGRAPDDPNLDATVSGWLDRQLQPLPGVTPKLEDQAKEIDALLTELSKTSDDALAASLVRAATELDSATFVPGTRILAQIARGRRPTPLGALFSELSFLDAMAALAPPFPSTEPGPWPVPLLRDAWALRLRASEAHAATDSDPWLGALTARAIDRADLATFLVLDGPGYVSEAAVLKAIGEAENELSELMRRQRLVSELRREVEAGTVRLAALGPLIASETVRDTRLTRDWNDAIDTARDGWALLETHAEGPSSPDASPSWITERAAQLTPRLRLALEALSVPVSNTEVDRLIEQARKDTDPLLKRRIDALLSTPLIDPSRRSRLVDAGYRLAKRLEATRAGTSAREGAEAATSETETAATAASWAIDLLDLGGWTGDLHALRKSLDAGDAAPLGEAWLGLADQAAGPAGINPIRADRLSRIVPPLRSEPLLDDPATNPTARRRGAELRSSWAARGWSARHLVLILAGQGDLSRSADLAAADFDKAARPSTGPGPATPRLPRLQITELGDPPRLSTASPTGTFALQATLMDASAAIQPSVTVLPASDPRLTARADAPPKLEPGVPAPISLALSWVTATRPDPTADIDEARGVVVVTRLGDISYPLVVSLPGLAGVDAPELLVGTDPETPPTSSPRAIAVRPKLAAQRFYLFVRNPGDREREVSIRVRVGGADLPGGTATVKVGPGKTQIVPAFTPPPGAPAAAAAPPTAAPAAAAAAPNAAPERMPALRGPIEVRLEVAAEKMVSTVRLPVELTAPSAYTEVLEAQFLPNGSGPDGKNRLEVRIQPTPAPSLAPAATSVRLELEAIPGQIGDPAVKNLSGTLQKADTPLTMFAEDIRLEPVVEDERGLVAVMIDDFDRAVLLGGAFLRRGGPQRLAEFVRPRLKIKAPLIALATKPLPVTVLVDNAPPDAKVEVELGRASANGFEAERAAPLGSPRDRHLGFRIEPDTGALAFEGAVKDWTIPLNVEGVRGPRTLRARLLLPNGAEEAADSIEVRLDDQPPRVSLDALPGPLEPSAPTISVRAVATADSGLAAVRFFQGAPINGALPQGQLTVPGASLDDGRTWTAQVPLEGVRPGLEVEVSVLAENNVGLIAFDTGTVAVRVPPPVMNEDQAKAKADAEKSKAEEPGSIAGVVRYDRIPQPGLTVTLYRLEGKDWKPADQVTTDAKGNYAFAKVKPGTYGLRSSKESDQRKGWETKKVEPGKKVKLDLPISR